MLRRALAGPMSVLQGKVALVTGGGRGLGAALVKAFAAEGAAVVAAARTRADVAAVAYDVESAGGRALAVAADVRREDDAAALVARTVKELGRLDVVVNNAGAFVHAARFPRLDVAEWDEAFDTNLKAPWLVAKHAAPHMDASGSIVNVTSGLAHVQYAPGAPRTASVPYAPYSIAKAALEDLTRVLAARVRPRVRSLSLIHISEPTRPY